MIDSVVADTKFMDEFIVVGAKTKSGPQSAPLCTPAAPTAATDKEGKVHCSPWEWIAMLESASIASRWRRSLKGGFCCAFCNSKDKHHPYKCPLLNKLGLKLVKVGGQSGGGQSGGGATMGTSSKPPAAASPASETTLVGSPPAPAPGFTFAPAGLTAAVIENNEGDKCSTVSFRWYGDKDEVEFKLNAAFSDYLSLQTFPSCCCASVATNAPRSSSLVPTSSTSSLDL
jgi:hypothetical protein